MLSAKQIHKRIHKNNHQWSVALNTFRVPTLTEVEDTINILKQKAARDQCSVESGGIIVFYNDGNLKVDYQEDAI
jgi:hypothetical protein